MPSKRDARGIGHWSEPARAHGRQEDSIFEFAAILLVGIGVLVALIWFGQRRLIYRPDTERVQPSAAGLAGVREVILPATDGTRLVTWFAPAGTKDLTVLYFPGNGAGLNDRSVRISMLQAAGFGVMMLAYRGYAGSTGSPSETANVADAKLCYAWLREHDIAAERIVLFGESLGTGVAVQVAAERTVAGVVLDSPFTSLVDVAATHFPYLPMRWLLRDRYDSMALIGRLRAPLLIVHGEQDSIVPFVLGQRLFAAAPEPKQHHAFARTGHLVPFDGPGWPVVRRFLEGLATGPAPRRP